MPIKNSIPETGFVRLSQILGDANSPPHHSCVKIDMVGGDQNWTLPKTGQARTKNPSLASRRPACFN